MTKAYVIDINWRVLNKKTTTTTTATTTILHKGYFLVKSAQQDSKTGVAPTFSGHSSNIQNKRRTMLI